MDLLASSTPGTAATIPPSWRTVANPGTFALFTRALDPALVSMVQVAASVTDNSLRRAGAVTHRALVEPIAAACGLTPAQASACGDVLDAFQIVIDLADNLTDIEIDRARGIDGLGRYAPVPVPALHCLPPLMMAAAVGSFPGLFPAPLRAQAAALRTTTVLGRMVLGQMAPEGSEARVDGASGQQGLLVCLPLWLSHDGSAAHDARLRSVERWAFLYGRTWQLHQEVLDHPGDSSRQQELYRGQLATRAHWPQVSPFRSGETLAQEAVLAGGLC